MPDKKPKIAAEHAMNSQTDVDRTPVFYGLCKNTNCTFETKKTYGTKKQAITAGKREHPTCSA